MPTNNTDQLNQAYDELLQNDDIHLTKDYYKKWALDYEVDARNMEYGGADRAAENLHGLNLPKDSRILDLGSGVGVIGALLKGYGYTNIDALDASPEMLELAKLKDCYQNFITSFVAPDIELPIETNTYDAVITAGVFCPGHISYRSFEQIIRVVKPGGIVSWVNSQIEHYAEIDEIYRDGQFDKYIAQLCDKKLWQSVPGYPKKVDNYFRGEYGWFHAMRVL